MSGVISGVNVDDVLSMASHDLNEFINGFHSALFCIVFSSDLFRNSVIRRPKFRSNIEADVGAYIGFAWFMMRFLVVKQQLNTLNVFLADRMQ